jgi:MFS family permease
VTDGQHRGWPVVAAFSAVCAGTQLLWLTYAPIDTGSAHYYGVSSGAIGWLANVFPLLYVALAIPAGRLLDSHFRPPLARRGAEPTFMRAAIFVSAAGCVALATIESLGARAAVLAAMGFVLLPALPVIISLAERLAGRAAGTAGAIVWMAGNLGGLFVALLVQALVHHQTAAFLTMAAVMLAGLPFAVRFPTTATLPTRQPGVP